jgi:hypothetical protein
LLLKEAVRRPFTGSGLTLGRQHIYFSHSDLVRMASGFGVRLHDAGEVALHRDADLAARGFISDTAFLRSLGFAEVKTLDYSAYEGCDYVFDLNQAELPGELAGRFDVIIDGGTMEHVFHVPNALRNLFAMLRVGGRVVHMSPSSNYVDHGFYSFSPTLFWDYYAANRFDVNDCKLIRHTPNHDTDPWEILDYQPGCLSEASYGGLDDAMYALYFVATKTPESTSDRIPQQGAYVAVWEQARGNAAAGAGQSPNGGPGGPGEGDRSQGRVPLVSALLRRAANVVRGWRKSPRRAKNAGLRVVDRL